MLRVLRQIWRVVYPPAEGERRGPRPVAPATALRDALVAWIAVEVLVAILVQLKWVVPGVGQVGGAGVAVLFLLAPIEIARLRGEDIVDYGFHLEGWRRSLLVAGVAVLVIVPLFAGGYLAFYELACHSDVLAALPMKGMCAAYGGLSALHAPRIDGDLLRFVPVQLVVVAIPEELFFRGYLLTLLEARFPPKRRWLGGGVGLALVISSLLFAAVHLPRDGGDPRALMTFFPGLLFGWMRSSTKSLAASTIAHASSNILVHVLDLVTRHA